jgi:hypothetical protein
MLAAAAGSALMALRRARAIGLTDDEDLAAYALCALTIAPNFDRHDRMQTVLQRCRTEAHRDGERFCALIDDLDEADKARMRAELTQAV